MSVSNINLQIAQCLELSPITFLVVSIFVAISRSVCSYLENGKKCSRFCLEVTSVNKSKMVGTRESSMLNGNATRYCVPSFVRHGLFYTSALRSSIKVSPFGCIIPQGNLSCGHPVKIIEVICQ